MPDVRSLFDKEFLYAYDLQGRDVTVKIVRVVGGKVTGKGGKAAKKPVVYFEGKEKGLALNITNVRTIKSLYGSFQSEDWIGKWVTLYTTTTEMGGETVECIRIRPTIPPARGAAPKPKPVTAPELPAELPPESEQNGQERGDEPSPEEWAGGGAP